ncbi:MAG: LysR substrate-binding domain-containing protein [Litorivicinus sp.]
MYRIDDAEVFCQVVDQGSFSKAGRSLRLSTAVVSARIAKLEERLGIRLLNRTTRSVSATEAGLVYYQACVEITAQMRDTLQRLDDIQNSPQGVIRISAPDQLGRKVIAPILGKFRQQYPSVDFRLHNSDRVVNLVEESVDIAIRHGYPKSSSLVMRPLAQDRWVVAGHPDYLQRRGAPTSLEQLKEHDCLMLRFPGSLQFQWQFTTPAGRQMLRLFGGLEASAAGVLQDWATSGLGLIQQSVWALYDVLDEAHLHSVLTQYEPAGLRINALMPEREHRPTKIGLLLDFLEAEMASHPALHHL